MSECDSQGILTVVLSFPRRVPHQRHRSGKVDSHHARNYTVKWPLSLTITRRYAVDPHCRKLSFLDRLGVSRDYRDGGLQETAGRPIRGAIANVIALSSMTHNHSSLHV